MTICITTRRIEVHGGRDLLHEAFGPEHRCEFRAQDLYRHLPLVLEVLGQVYGGHATFAEVALDLVAVREGGREPGGDLGHEAKLQVMGLRGENPRIVNPWNAQEPPSDLGGRPSTAR